MKPLPALCLPPFQLALAAETHEYVILRQGKPAGYRTLTKSDDGAYRSIYYSQDNGRGPEMTEESTLRPDGIHKRFKVTDKTTFGSTVDESFVRAGDHVESMRASPTCMPAGAVLVQARGRRSTMVRGDFPLGAPDSD